MESILNERKFEKIRPIFDKKLKIYNTYNQFYSGSVYYDRSNVAMWQLYGGIEMFFNILSRAVDMDTHLVPNGFTLTEDSSDKLVKQVEQIRKWSNWKSQEFLYVHYGALFGDSYLKVIDKPDKVMIKPIDPRWVWLEDDYALIIYTDEFKKEQAEYITKDTITLYEDGKVIDSYRNLQGQIPLIHIQHKDVGEKFGKNTFHNVLPQFNTMNELSSLLKDAIVRNINGILYLIGVQPTEIERNADKAMFLPEGAEVGTLTPTVPVNQVLDFIKEVKDEAKAGLPELAFDDLRAKERLAAETLEVQLKELAVKILRSRANYDLGYETAMKMAFKAAVNRGLRMDNIKNKPGFEELDVTVDFNRPTIPLSIREELSIELIRAQRDATLANTQNPTVNGDTNDRPTTE